MTRLNGKVDRQEQAECTEDERQYDRESALAQTGQIAGRQRQDEAAVLDRGDDHGCGAQQYERYSNAARKIGRRRDRSGRWHALGSEKAQEKAEAGHHEPEAHDGEAGANPRKEGSFGCEEDARVRRVHLRARVSLINSIWISWISTSLSHW